MTPKELAAFGRRLNELAAAHIEPEPEDRFKPSKVENPDLQRFRVLANSHFGVNTMIKFQEMTLAQLAEYIGEECCEVLAAGVLSRCIEADYQYPHEVPEMHWLAFIECAHRDMRRSERRDGQTTTQE